MELDKSCITEETRKSKAAVTDMDSQTRALGKRACGWTSLITARRGPDVRSLLAGRGTWAPRQVGTSWLSARRALRKALLFALDTEYMVDASAYAVSHVQRTMNLQHLSPPSSPSGCITFVQTRKLVEDSRKSH
jgi:hypothetical protein